MFNTSITKSNTLLAKSITAWANKKLITITDFDSLMSQLDKDFELDDKNVLVRRQTGRMVDGDIDRHYSLMVRSNVSDKSFGAHRSFFTPRRTSDTERADIDKLFTRYKGAGLRDETLTTLKETFIVDQGKLRKLDKNTGYISTETFDPDYVLQKYEPGIDPAGVELNTRRERLPMFKMATELSLGEGPKVTARLFSDLEKINSPKYQPLAHDFIKQAEDMKKKSLSYIAVLSEKDLTLAEMNRIEILQKTWLQKLNEL
jgi:hypothetical protein